METLIKESLAASVMDALISNICVVDLSGNIKAVNRAWMEFHTHNGGRAEQPYLGTNYLNVCLNFTGPASTEASVLYD